ncbi:carbohydrate-binding module family 50 protein [Aspergillus aculeatus ATCC 16872]|uniref:Carbohydrate-binding module family 50 protein n=1 Tax=Aspergillus aculeatus (strain ATCC 16872 / CBS 172.66 / WB 5094) TaxID=690307 RepID=A0A1L9WUX3_ASPA1|nr:carbohydrate-binding module family 50 protein [Aspergillus aculeatus ATCC 16872]OJJ99923.1 carbohydrate-binding module family 50 protein [Aspergillus aculeatus ATCC 16872]
MGHRKSLLLAASCFFITGQAAHSLSHGYFHHRAEHQAHPRTADSDNASSTSVSMFPNGTLSGLGLSSTCENALYQTLDCNDAVSLIDTDDYSDSLDNATLTALICASSCEASIAQLHDSVSANCGSSAELIPGMSFLALVDQFWSSWNQSCFVDPTTGENCNDEIASFANVDSLSNISTSDLCSYCYVKKLELMQADAYSDAYNDDWQSTFEYVAATCNLTVADFNATASAFNASVPTTTPSCVSGNVYTTQDGDTCDSIALAEGVSAATMYYTNPNILNCSAISAGTALCLPLTCTDVYSVQPNDTCSTVAVANFITTAEVINWNSQLTWNCSNLHSTNPNWGSVLCVSPPGGTYTGQALNTTSSGEAEAVDPPAGVQVALGTTLDCGAWFVNEASLNYNCSDICLANSIAIHLFTEANPSLNYTTCDSDLVTGDAYCVDPLSGWQYSNMTATNGTLTTVTAATTTSTSVASVTPPGPTQSGIPSNCDEYYVAQTGDNCATVATKYDITEAQFLAWNPAISSDCTTGFWADEAYCVSVS